MQHAEFLNTIAAVAITLMGFAGIVIVVGERRGAAGWTAIERVLFYAMLTPPLTALFCALTPELLSTVIGPPALVWRTANGILGAAHLANVAPVVAKARTIKTNWLQRGLLVSGLACVVAHFLAAAGLLAWIELIFMLGLIQQLMVGLLNFLQLVLAEPPPAP